MVEPEAPLIWLGGNPGDGWYEMTQGLVALLNAHDPTLGLALVAGGGEENLSNIQNGVGMLGMSIDIVVSAAVNGAAPFDSPMPKLHCIGTGWSPLPYNLIRPVDAPLDLGTAIARPGFRVGAPPRDTTDELTFQRVVAHYGTSYAEIEQRQGRVLLAGYDALIAALDAGEIDWVFGATTMPAPSIAAAVDGDRDVELVDLPAELVEFLARQYGCRPGVIPADTYAGLQRGEVTTAFVDTVFVISADASASTAYRITRALLDNLDRLPGIHSSLALFNPYTAWRNTAAALHPGAACAYRELHFMD